MVVSSIGHMLVTLAASAGVRFTLGTVNLGAWTFIRNGEKHNDGKHYEYHLVHTLIINDKKATFHITEDDFDNGVNFRPNEDNTIQWDPAKLDSLIKKIEVVENVPGQHFVSLVNNEFKITSK